MKPMACIAVCFATLLTTPPGWAQQPPRADPAPWVEAFTARFLECLDAEGTTLAPDARQQAGSLVAQTAAGLAPRVLEAGCWTDAPSMRGCADAVRRGACNSIEVELDALTAPTEPPPPWASAWARAIRNKVLGCYEAEQGAPVADSQTLADLARFTDGLASALAPLATGCQVDEEKLVTCRTALASMECSALAEALEPGGGGLVQTMTAACKGFVRCGLDTGDDDGSRILVPGVDNPRGD